MAQVLIIPVYWILDRQRDNYLRFRNDYPDKAQCWSLLFPFSRMLYCKKGEWNKQKKNYRLTNNGV
jgi:hypothetical protein